MAPKNKIPPIIACSSVDLLDYELSLVCDGLNIEETEDSWDKIAQALLRFSALVNGSTADFPSQLIASAKSLARPINSALNSERSRLSGTATDLLTAFAVHLRRSFDPLIPLYVPPLLAMATRSSKIFVSRAKMCLLAVVEHVQTPALLPLLRFAVTDKSASLRLVATELVFACLNCYNPPDIEIPARAEDIEAIIRTTARDASADVRKSSRSVFEAYKILLPARIDTFVAPLTPTMKKYLDIKAKTTASAVPPARQKPILLSASLPGPVLNHDVSRPRNQGHKAATDMPPPPPLIRAPSSGPVRPPPGMRHTVAPARPLSVHLPRPTPTTSSSSSTAFDITKSQPVGSSRGGAQRPTSTRVQTNAAVAVPHPARPQSADLIRPGATKLDMTRSMRPAPTPALTLEDLKASSGPRRVPKAPVNVPSQEQELARCRELERDKISIAPAGADVRRKEKEHDKSEKEKKEKTKEKEKREKATEKEKEKKEKALLAPSFVSVVAVPTNTSGNTRMHAASHDEARSSRARAALTSSTSAVMKASHDSHGFRPASRNEKRSRSRAPNGVADMKERVNATKEEMARGAPNGTEALAKYMSHEREYFPPQKQAEKRPPVVKSQISGSISTLTSVPAPQNSNSDPALQDAGVSVDGCARIHSVSVAYLESNLDIAQQPVPDYVLATSTCIVSNATQNSEAQVKTPTQTVSTPGFASIQQSTLPTENNEGILSSLTSTSAPTATCSELVPSKSSSCPDAHEKVLAKKKDMIRALSPLPVKSNRVQAPKNRIAHQAIRPLVIRKPHKGRGQLVEGDSINPSSSEEQKSEAERGGEEVCVVAADMPLPQSPTSNCALAIPKEQFCTPAPLRVAAQNYSTGVAATPISALLISIERGFDVSVIGEESEGEVNIDLTMPYPQELPLNGPRYTEKRSLSVCNSDAEADGADFFVDKRIRRMKAASTEEQLDGRTPLATLDGNC